MTRFEQLCLRAHRAQLALMLRLSTENVAITRDLIADIEHELTAGALSAIDERDETHG